MYLSCYVNLREGDRGVIVDARHPDCGRAVTFVRMEYAMQLPLYVFETDDCRRVVFASEFDFRIVPYRDSLLALIDLAIGIRDEAWFRELAERLRCPDQYQ